MIKNIEHNLNSSNFQIPDYKKIVSKNMINNIRKVEYFKQSQYSDLEIAETLEFYTNRYVRQLLDFTSIGKNTIIVDAGAGFGWLSMAFAYSTEAQLIAIDADEFRLDAGKQIANILEVENKIDWRIGRLGRLPLNKKEANVVYCVEVLEHVYRDTGTIHDLCRVSNDLVIITTPNLWFPIIAHDTQLPFCHWLPIPIRKTYAKLFSRGTVENNNLFWSPYFLQKNMVGFKPISNWLHYSSLKKFRDTFPFYLPYGKGRYVNKLGYAKKIYYEIISRLGMYSHYMVPSLSYVFKREK